MGVTLTGNYVSGDNITNDTVITKLYVWNTEPELYNVTVSPAVIDLTPGNTTKVTCTGEFWDYNGWQDVGINGSVSAVLYHVLSSKAIDPDDKNYHFSNSSCVGNTSCVEIAGSNGLNGTCNCTFEVDYFANNGSWECNMTIVDGGRNITDPDRIYTFNDTLTGSALITSLVAFDVASDTIDYGNLSVTETSDNMTENLTNLGNRPINISVYGYGNESNPLNYSMICEYGQIPAGYERYSVNVSADYDSMIQLSNESVGIQDFKLPQRVNDAGYGSDRNQTYWRLQIPLSMGGVCNGTIIFEATETNP